MKILAINGSPRGKNGVTWWVLEKFLDGAQKTGTEVETVHLNGKNIHPCTGELACWTKTPGKCIHNDDMGGILDLYRAADAVVLATPVYVDGMTGLLKNCIDRMVPVADPHFTLRDGHCRHPARGTAKPKTVALVSVCGFYEMDNFDPLLSHVRAVCRNMDAKFAGAILRPGGPMFPEIPTIHPLFFKIRAVKEAIHKAGEEFAVSGVISEETELKAAAAIISKEDYVKLVNEHFDKTGN